MTILYMPDEKVPIKVDNITITIQQLTMAQKAAILEKLTQANNPMALIEASTLAVKYGVKAVEGVTLSNGKPYSVELEGDVLSDSSVAAVLCLPQTDKIQGVCFTLLKGITNPLVDANGKPIPGVEIVSSKSRKAAKN